MVGELVLLDATELAPGASGLVQLRLEHPIVCAPGDPFILRLASPLSTLGGGRILEESRHRLKRFKDFVLEELGRQEGSLGTPEELLEVLKQEKLVLDWRRKQQTRAAVRVTVREVLDRLPDSFSADMWQKKVDTVYQHIFDSYYGEGRSVYTSAAA